MKPEDLKKLEEMALKAQRYASNARNVAEAALNLSHRMYLALNRARKNAETKENA